jgi:hypothetical protein
MDVILHEWLFTCRLRRVIMSDQIYSVYRDLGLRQSKEQQSATRVKRNCSNNRLDSPFGTAYRFRALIA